MDKSYDDILSTIGMEIYNEQFEQHLRGQWYNDDIDLEEINEIIDTYFQ